MKTLEKHFELDAGHRLAEHDFKCQNLHGHRYQFDVRVEGEESPTTGMVVDFAHLKEPVMEAFDHTTLLNEDDPLLDLRDTLEGMQNKSLYVLDSEPTAENIAEESLDLIVEAFSEDEQERVEKIEITLFETPNSSVEAVRRL